jgi:TolA-binding protein
MESYPRWTYVVIFTLLVVVVVLSVRALRKKTVEPVAIAPVEKNAPPQESARSADKRQENTPTPGEKPDNQVAERSAESDRRIQELTADVERLRKENEANSGRVKELEAKLDEAQQKLKVAQKQLARTPAPPAPLTRDRTVAQASPPPKDRTVTPAPPAATTPPPQAPPRRASDAGPYEVVRDTALLEKPSSTAREVALVQRGIIVNVVSTIGDWYEVRSKYGKPPGYIRREDVTPKPTQSENRDRF